MDFQFFKITMLYGQVLLIVKGVSVNYLNFTFPIKIYYFIWAKRNNIL